MNDSTNIRIIADNIRKLFSKASASDSRISDLETAATRIPKDFSTTETDTGLKFGNDVVYQRTFTGETPSEAGTLNIGTISGFKDLIHMYGSVISTTSTPTRAHAFERAFDPSIATTTGNIDTSVAATYVNSTYIVTILYTKTVPEPAPGNETKKKTTKKG